MQLSLQQCVGTWVGLVNGMSCCACELLLLSALALCPCALRGLRGWPSACRLRAVAHSLGGAALLMYAVMRRRQQRPHHLARLILLTPAGFLKNIPIVGALPRTARTCTPLSSRP